jgi:hypothetical protein
MTEQPEGYELYATPPFLRSKADQTLALMRERGVTSVAALWGVDTILAPLTPLDDDHCDGCDRRVGKALIHTGRIFEELDGHVVTFTFGVCGECKQILADAEGQ